MESVTLLSLLGNYPEIETNNTAGRMNSKESAFSFSQIIEALLNLLNASGRTDNKGEGDFLDPTVIGEKKQREDKEQPNFSRQGISLSQQNTGEPLLSIGTDAQPKQNNYVMADILEFLSLLTVKGTDNSPSSEKVFPTAPFFATLLSGKADLHNVLQGSTTNAVQEGRPAYGLQESVQQKQGFSVFADVVATTESKMQDAAVKAEAAMPDSAQLERLLADSLTTATEKTAEAMQDKLFKQFSGVQIKEQPVSVSPQDSPSVQNKTNQFSPLTTGIGSTSIEALLGSSSKRNDLPIAKDMLPDHTMELIAQQIVDKAELFVGKERADLRLQLNPDFLGQLKLVIRVENGVIHAHFIAENQITASLIEGQMQDLRQCLEQQGISWQQVSVTVGGQDSFQRHNGYATYNSSEDKCQYREDATPDEQREYSLWQEGIVDYLV